jgi:enterochelin esterase-like enzyme
MICVRENYLANLLPFIEKTYRASSDPNHRAFAGLSLGSELTYEMYINATETFSYFGHFSGARGPASSDTNTAGYISNETVAANPALADRGVFVGFGNFDIAFSDCRAFETALSLAGVPFLSRFVPWGSHFWNTWQDTLWYFGRAALWKQRPFTPETVRQGRVVY